MFNYSRRRYRNIISDDIILTESLTENDKLVYELFINLIGLNNLILTDVNIDNDVICFNRIKLFAHDENYNILNLGSELKSYNDYNEEEKHIIDEFITLINNN